MHEDTASDEVDTVHPQADSLAPAQAGVGEEEDQGGVLAGFVREDLDLFVAEIMPLLPDLPGQIHASSRIGEQSSVLDRGIHDSGQDAVRSQHYRRTLGGGQRADPLLNFAVANLTDQPMTPQRLDVHAPSDLDDAVGAGLEVSLRAQPTRAELGNRDSGCLRVDVFTGGLAHFGGREEEFRVTFCPESAFVSLGVVWFAVPHPVSLAQAGFVRSDASHGSTSISMSIELLKFLGSLLSITIAATSDVRPPDEMVMDRA